MYARSEQVILKISPSDPLGELTRRTLARRPLREEPARHRSVTGIEEIRVTDWSKVPVALKNVRSERST